MKTFSEKAIKNIRDAARKRKPIRYWLGKKRPDMTGNKNPRWKGGKKKCISCSKEIEFYARKCNSCKGEDWCGEKNHNWKGGVTSLCQEIRHLPHMKRWRSSVFQRDNWTCQTCGKRGTTLEAHHGKRFSEIMKENNIQNKEDAISCSKMWDINNGVTLCIPCHNLLPKRVT